MIIVLQFNHSHPTRSSLRHPTHSIPPAALLAGPSHRSPSSPTVGPVSPEILSLSTLQRTSRPPHSELSPSSFHDLNPANYAPAHESRRRNAEQRAATLRADTLIGEVEPNRVFCSLCQKWVQLRQDSSYCAYPWLQHRGKCLARQYVASHLLSFDMDPDTNMGSPSQPTPCTESCRDCRVKGKEARYPRRGRRHVRHRGRV